MGSEEDGFIQFWFYSYLDAKRLDDGVEDGLWRIHDSLYDLTDFIKSHPGGPDWLILTKGTDITEAYETHHLYPEKLEPYLKKYYVRPASTPKNMKLTFHPDGFYITLRKRVSDKLRQIDVKATNFRSKVERFNTFLNAFPLNWINDSIYFFNFGLGHGRYAVCAHDFAIGRFGEIQ